MRPVSTLIRLEEAGDRMDRVEAFNHTEYSTRTSCSTRYNCEVGVIERCAVPVHSPYEARRTLERCCTEHASNDRSPFVQGFLTLHRTGPYTCQVARNTTCPTPISLMIARSECENVPLVSPTPAANGACIFSAVLPGLLCVLGYSLLPRTLYSLISMVCPAQS